VIKGERWFLVVYQWTSTRRVNGVSSRSSRSFRSSRWEGHCYSLELAPTSQAGTSRYPPIAGHVSLKPEVDRDLWLLQG